MNFFKNSKEEKKDNQPVVDADSNASPSKAGQPDA
jgi:hypothetical protein